MRLAWSVLITTRRFAHLADPATQPIEPARQHGGGGVAGVRPAGVDERLGRTLPEAGERGDGVIRERPVRAGARPSAARAAAPVLRLVVERAGQRGQLIVVGQHQVRRRRQVIGSGRAGQQRSPRLGRLGHVALLQMRQVCLQHLGQASRRAFRQRAPALGGQEFAGRQQRDLLEAAPGCLGDRIEGADRVDLVAEEIQPHRFAGAGRPDVDDAAARGELADAADLDRDVIARRHQRPEQGVLVDPLPNANVNPQRVQLPHRHRPLHQRQQGCDQHGAPWLRCQPGQRAQSLGGFVVLRQSALERHGRTLEQDADAAGGQPRRPGHRPGGGPRPRSWPPPPSAGQPAGCYDGQPGARRGPEQAPRACREAAGVAPARRSAPRRDGLRRHASAPDRTRASEWRWSCDRRRQVQAVELVHGRLDAVAQPQFDRVGRGRDRLRGQLPFRRLEGGQHVVDGHP